LFLAKASLSYIDHKKRKIAGWDHCSENNARDVNVNMQLVRYCPSDLFPKYCLDYPGANYRDTGILPRHPLVEVIVKFILQTNDDPVS